MANDENEQAVIVDLKFPPFWMERPDVWFRQIEAQFKIKNIRTENRKFDHLISQLDRKFVADIFDILDTASDTKYSLAKERLLSLYKESDDAQIKRLLDGLELGDQRPSQLLRKMTSLAGTDISNKVLRTLWLDKLPVTIKNILVVSEENLEKLALMADKITDMNPRRDVYNIANDDVGAAAASPQSSTEDLIREMYAKIQSLEIQVSSLRQSRSRRSSPDDHYDRRGRSQNRYRYRSPSRSRNRSRGRFNPDGKFCFSHFRFGNRCRPEKCQPPCEWKNGESGNARPPQN
ncbi:Hypothetical protein NTJ_02390 [Nesidiocoris tenuis]|uniref:DUF7041 domain-containing protein n=1 Tax=Nesidiocoris tenuis TaxID=355587 RepID=A0ABN7A6I4_9HEMI|nr:Hypothetical protein NTJ_00333 [Nesidiocoris tenuis]BES89583.1 Hypothetical protein NTJ_02390 [Nesidiocoris tenuis]